MNRIKELRLEKKLTQKEVADYLSINQTAVGKYERGELEPNLTVINSLADFFNVSTDYLLGRTDDFGNTVPSPYSQEEQQLISDYRALEPHLKLMIQETIKTWKRADLNRKADIS